MDAGKESVNSENLGLACMPIKYLCVCVVFVSVHVKYFRDLFIPKDCLVFTRACTLLRQLGHLHHSLGCSVQAGRAAASTSVIWTRLELDV